MVEFEKVSDGVYNILYCNYRQTLAECNVDYAEYS